jgi:Excalibur calcium-binding domain
MAKSSDKSLGTILAVALIAFFVGRMSVDDVAVESKPATSTAQQFMAEETPVPDDTPASLTEAVFAEPAPAPQAPTYFENCDAARAAGAAPVMRGDPGYARRLDRDHDGIGCE